MIQMATQRTRRRASSLTSNATQVKPLPVSATKSDETPQENQLSAMNKVQRWKASNGRLTISSSRRNKHKKLYPYWKGKRIGDGNNVDASAMFYLSIILAMVAFFFYVLFRPASSRSLAAPEPNSIAGDVPAYVQEVSPSEVVLPTATLVLATATPTLYSTALFSDAEYRATAAVLLAALTPSPMPTVRPQDKKVTLWMGDLSLCPEWLICLPVYGGN